MVVGGVVKRGSGVALGPHANEMLRHLNVRKTVLSVAGINDRGFFNCNSLLIETEKAMMAAAEEVIVVADSTKFGHQGLTHLCPLDAVQRLVVDHEIDKIWRGKVEAAGVKLAVADAPAAEK